MASKNNAAKGLTLWRRLFGGAREDRTPDLLNAIQREAYIRTGNREHVRGLVPRLGLRRLLVTQWSADFHHERCAKDQRRWWVVAGRAITRGTFVIEHHPTLHRGQCRCETSGGGDVKRGISKTLPKKYSY